MGRPSSSCGGRTSKRSPELNKFATFVTNVISRAEVTMPTVLGTLVYIDRAKPHLHIALEEWAHERVFLGALICASKYLNDSTLKNVHWALCTGVFGKRDVGRIEREFLDVLDFELGVAEHDFLSHHEGLIAATRISSPSSRPSRTFVRPHSRSRALTQTHKQLPVPPLEPSSPESSLSPASASPQTPCTSASSSPLRTPEDNNPNSTNNKHVSVPASKPQTDSELLRSFPIPLPAPIRTGHNRISTQDYVPRSRIAVRVI